MGGAVSPINAKRWGGGGIAPTLDYNISVSLPFQLAAQIRSLA